LARRNGKCVWTGNTWEYFDPTKYLWGIYQPKPFFVEMCTYQVTGNMEVVLRKLSEKEGKEKRVKFMKETFPNMSKEIKENE
jgi:hypothetical protein